MKVLLWIGGSCRLRGSGYGSHRGLYSHYSASHFYTDLESGLSKNSEQKVAKLEAQVSEKEQQLSYVRALEHEVDRLRGELERIHSSFGWMLLKTAIAVRKWVIPKGSRRWAAYEACIRHTVAPILDFLGRVEVRWRWKLRTLPAYPQQIEATNCEAVPPASRNARASTRVILEPAAPCRFGGDEPVRLIAFYLPQFHPIPENDAWWGKGFTEWTNVTRARPLFPGHDQPHLPADLGFYDLRVAEVREAQADLAREYGIYGFCYYHYWFNGRRILQRPFQEVLASGRPDFPFCICWANEPWTRSWDGWAGEVLLPQEHSLEDDRAHIERLVPALQDPRYIRVSGKPLLLVYRTELLPDPARTAEVWREVATRAGIGDLYLARVESFVRGVNPGTIGFDAAVEFVPNWAEIGPPKFRGPFPALLRRTGLLSRAYGEHRIVDYGQAADRLMQKKWPSYVWFRGVTPSWDNSPRRAHGALILHGSKPEKYGAWLQAIVRETVAMNRGDERFVFINAWNEWAEGNHLEPDQRWGRAYLEATARAVANGVARAR